MKTISLILLILLPITFFAQNKYEDEAKFINKYCNEESYRKAKEIYTELQIQQTNNSFDTTLKGYYEFLESTNCGKYNSIIVAAWKNDKVINEKSFKSFFKNSNDNYSDFIIGYVQKMPFRFANPNAFDQGIDEKLQSQMLKYVKSVSDDDYIIVVSSNIEILEGHELKSFMSVLKSNFSLKEFEKEIIEKSYSTNYAFDLDFLISQLFDLNTDKSIIEKILNEKKNVWDKGNWSNKFWTLIKQKGLKINQGNSYTISNQGEKKYDIKVFISKQKENDFIGNNPLLLVNSHIYKYEEGTLIETLEILDIKDIEVKSKHNATSLYGARGKDGVLMIVTN